MGCLFYLVGFFALFSFNSVLGDVCYDYGVVVTAVLAFLAGWAYMRVGHSLGSRGQRQDISFLACAGAAPVAAAMGICGLYIAFLHPPEGAPLGDFTDLGALAMFLPEALGMSFSYRHSRPSPSGQAEPKIRLISGPQPNLGE